MKRTFKNIKRLVSTTLVGLALASVSTGTQFKAMNYSCSHNFSYHTNDESVISNDFFVGLGISSLLMLYGAYRLASNGPVKQEETKTIEIKRTYNEKKSNFNYKDMPSYVPSSPYLNGNQGFQDYQQYDNFGGAYQQTAYAGNEEQELPSLEEIEAVKQKGQIDNDTSNPEPAVYENI